MFVQQGARQFEIFTGKPAPEEEMFRVVLHALRQQIEAAATAEAAESKGKAKPAKAAPAKAEASKPKAAKAAPAKAPAAKAAAAKKPSAAARKKKK
jgi:3-dehydroquinate dehydratase/shikimate dehydrogenase